MRKFKSDTSVRHFFYLLLALGCFTTTSAQEPGILTSKQVSEIFPDSISRRLNIDMPIFRIYKYADKTGQYYCILTGSRNQITPENDTINHRIKAINVKAGNGSFSRLWEINDNIIKNDDGRIKFIIYYKGQKVAIRHQNGVLDFERETQVDGAFYNLPQPLQATIKQK